VCHNAYSHYDQSLQTSKQLTSPSHNQEECVVLAQLQKNVPFVTMGRPNSPPKLSLPCSCMHLALVFFREFSMHVVQNTGFSLNVPSMTSAMHIGCMLGESGHRIVRSCREKMARWHVLINFSTKSRSKPLT